MEKYRLAHPLNNLKINDIENITDKSHLYNRNINVSNKELVVKNPYTLYLDYIKFVSSMLKYYPKYIEETGLDKSEEEYMRFITLLINSQLELGVSFEEIEKAMFFAKFSDKDIELLKSVKELLEMGNINYNNISKIFKKEARIIEK